MGCCKSRNNINFLYNIPQGKGALFELKRNPFDINEAIEVKYIQKKVITNDTFIFVYELPKKMHLGLELGKHIAIDAIIKTNDHPEGEQVSRKYTPISWIMEQGKIELLVKVYYKDINPNWPEGGKMSQYLDSLELESLINIRGPFGRFSYHGNGLVNLKDKERIYKNFGCIAGGTGITPIYQILQAANKNKDVSSFFLIFANKTPDDILLKSELENFVSNNNFKFNLFFTVDKDWPENWTGGKGFITHDMLENNLPNPNDETLILTCGPPAMTRNHLLPLLTKIGHSTENIFEF